jgi:predicted amidohydrolase
VLEYGVLARILPSSMSEATRLLTVAMAQILVEGGQPAANLRRAAEAIARAAERGADIVLLPECLDLGWTHPSARHAAQPIPGLHCDVLMEAAARSGIYVVAGLVELAGGKIYNSAVVIDATGKLLHLHRKIHELDFAQELYATGDRLGVVDTPLGVLGVSICADNFPESLSIGHVLARMAAQIILSPSSWAVSADHDNEREPYGELWQGAYAELHRWYDLPVVAVSHVGRLEEGPWKGRKVIGCSMAFGGTGEVLAQAPYGEAAEALVLARVPLRPAASPTGTRLAAELRRRGYSGG